jgi:hypothetical protein
MTDSGTPISASGINIYNEKSLHADLKQWYARAEDLLEIKMDGYIIDLVRGDLLVEIQTGSFSPLKRKLARLLESHTVRLVYPIPAEKWIVMRSWTDGELPRKRKSPKRGCAEQLFAQTIYIPHLIQNDNFSIEVLFTREEEFRRPVEKKHRRSKGWVTEERRLLDVVGSQVFQTAADLMALLPAGLPEVFSVRDLARAMRQPPTLARKAVYTLREMGLISPVGRKGRALQYSRIA